MRVEIIGGMGVGKTTLCKQLSASGLHCVYEALEQNPYLEASYKDPQQYGFYSQIAFITANFHTLSQYNAGNEVTFLDFSTITDRAYSSIFLKGRARSLALEMINFLDQKEGMADLYIHLTCSTETQLERIRGRNRPHERRVGRKFVTRLNNYIDHYVHEAERNGARIHTVDTDIIDLRDNYEFITALTKGLRQDLQAPYTRIVESALAGCDAVSEEKATEELVRYAA